MGEDVPDCDEGWRMEGDRRNEVEKHELDISSEELKNLQALDSTLEEIRRTVSMLSIALLRKLCVNLQFCAIQTLTNHSYCKLMLQIMKLEQF